MTLTPIGSPLRSNGTPSILRNLPILCDSNHVNSLSASASGKMDRLAL